jgi:thiol-disulfide isomerase/thioredoxin
MMSLGPVPMTLVSLLAALGVAMVTAHWGSRAEPPEVRRWLRASLIDMLMVGLVVARVAFVMAWLPQYSAAPLTVLQINDGGFVAWPGIAAAVAFGAWRMRHNAGPARVLLGATMVGIGLWFAVGAALHQFQRETLTVPSVALSALEDGRATHLSDWPDRPLVVNLWASWCPPCRREMPALADAQRRYPGVTFAFVNQGESAQTIRDYLERDGLTLDNVLIDPDQAVGAAFRSGGLPATLFFDATGRLVSTHFGALSPASIAREISRLPGPSGP